MRKLAIVIAVVAVFALVPVWAVAATIEGSVQGFNCVTIGKVCPVGKEDPMISVENVFVVLTKDKDYYFVPNISRMVLARHFNQVIRVTGLVSAQYKSIRADLIEVLDRGSWKKTWSKEDLKVEWWDEDEFIGEYR